MNALAAFVLAGTAAATSVLPEVRVQPIRSHRGLPHAFHDQAVASVAAASPPGEIVEQLRAETRGDLSYALVAWKSGPQAPRVEINAVAVNGRHAWFLDVAGAASAYPALRAAVNTRLQALSAPYVPAPAQLTVRGQSSLGEQLSVEGVDQIIAATGWGDWFPWSVPALFSGVVGPRSEQLGVHSYVLVFLTSVIGLMATYWYWRNADQTR